MTPTLLAHTIAGASSGSTSTVTTSAIDTRGATLLVMDSAGFDPLSFTPSDSAGNTWTAATLQGLGTGADQFANQLFFCPTPTTSAAHTFSMSSSGSGFLALGAAAFSGTSASTAIDQQGGGGDVGRTSVTGSLTTTQDGELFIFAVGLDSGTNSPAFTGGLTIIDELAYSSTNHEGLAWAYAVQPVQGLISSTASWANATGISVTAVSLTNPSAPTGPAPLVLGTFIFRSNR